MDSKHWLTSKTMWANVIALGAVVISYFGIEGPDEKVQAEILIGFMAVLNLILRAVTTKPVTLSKEPMS